ncbi:MAG: AbrB/MazE/SpoVT family DNA-binding domain-containing protein [Chlamydiales bacterium]|nr:AbrB/MazE/SpoVT family DNA-binding domain-containing protein [Chlamydiales bacterium]
MLKKIVKYGNSSALVLDKAILELLNMGEGSVVKIKTDGVSLIITPQHALVQEAISPTLTIESAFDDAVKNCIVQSFGGDSGKATAFQEGLNEIIDCYKKVIEEKKNNPELQGLAVEQINQEMDALLKKYPAENAQDWDATNVSALREGFAEIHKKYEPLLIAVAALMETPEYIHEMALLAEKYQDAPDATHSKEYLEAYTQLVAKNIPEYAVYQDELKKMGEKYSQQAKKKMPTRAVARKK